MSSTVHNHSTVREGDRAAPVPAEAGLTARKRPRWLLPALLAAVIVAALVAGGVLSFSNVLYAGLFGGMILMHLGGHGAHGGHRTPGAPGGGSGGDDGPAGPAGHDGHDGHAGHADDAIGGGDLRNHSSGAQSHQRFSGDEPDDNARPNERWNETKKHDKDNSHGCH